MEGLPTDDGHPRQSKNKVGMALLRAHTAAACLLQGTVETKALSAGVEHNQPEYCKDHSQSVPHRRDSKTITPNPAVFQYATAHYAGPSTPQHITQHALCTAQPRTAQPSTIQYSTAKHNGKALHLNSLHCTPFCKLQATSLSTVAWSSALCTAG